MKKVFLILITIIFLSGCSRKEQNIADEIASWAVENVVYDGLSSIDLPSKHPQYDAIITWEATNSNLIDLESKTIYPQETKTTLELICSVSYRKKTTLKVIILPIEAADVNQIAEMFIKQFNDIIARSYQVETNYDIFGGTTVSWSSSNQEVFSNEGVYNAPFDDTEFTISFTLTTTNPFIVKDYKKTFVAKKMTDLGRLKAIRKSLYESVGQDGFIGEDDILPQESSFTNVSLKWHDSNYNEINSITDVNSYIIPNVGVDLIVLVTMDQKTFELVMRYQTKESNEIANMRIINSIDLIKEIKVGWNLGNTFDSPNEMAWGNPKTTKAMIDKVKAAGFNVIRIPVTWEGHFSLDGNYTIDEQWLNRYQEVVNYAIDENTFVIINMHHERWNNTTYQNQERAAKIMEKLWTQIGQRFSEYDEHLIFEGMNEPRIYDASNQVQWSGIKESFEVINYLNQVFVNTIRSLGGNNRYRHLMITTNGAGTSETIINNLVVPLDKHIIVSVHSYDPYDFAHDKTSNNKWDINNRNDTAPISEVFNRLYEKFIKNDIAVIMGEFASRDKNNLNNRLEWLQYYLSMATRYHIPCIWWDTGQVKTVENMTFSIFDRRNLEWLFPEIIDVLMQYSPSLEN